MKRFYHVPAIAIAILTTLAFCFPVHAELSLNGDLEIDTAYLSTSADGDPDTDETIYDLGGRIRVVPYARTEAGNLFMEAKAELLAKTDNTDGNGVQIDDAYGKIGTSMFDIQIGRYEAWNLQDESNDMLIVEAPNAATRYEANYARGRIDGAGQLALHVLPNDVFGLELGFVYGQESTNLGYTDVDDNPVETDTNMVGFRPVIFTKFGPVEFSAGADMLNITPQDDNGEADISKFGFGARVKATLGIATLGINYASGIVGGTDTEGDDLADQTTNSMGGYCDLAIGQGVLTLAAFYTTWEEDDNDYDKNHLQYYATYAHPLPIEGATIKFAASFANATEESAGGDIDSSASGFKVRLNYNF